MDGEVIEIAGFPPNKNKVYCKNPPFHLSHKQDYVMFPRLSENLCFFDVSHGKMNLGAALMAETLFKEQAFKEQLLYQGQFFFAFLQSCGAVPQCEEQSLQNIPNRIPQ